MLEVHPNDIVTFTEAGINDCTVWCIGSRELGTFATSLKIGTALIATGRNADRAAIVMDYDDERVTSAKEAFTLLLCVDNVTRTLLILSS